MESNPFIISFNYYWFDCLPESQDPTVDPAGVDPHPHVHVHARHLPDQPKYWKDQQENQKIHKRWFSLKGFKKSVLSFEFSVFIVLKQV